MIDSAHDNRKLASHTPKTEPAPTPRIWNEKGFIPFRLEVLTPVFIGSGEDFSPLEYGIREKSGTYYLYLVDTGAWLLEAQNNSAVKTALDKGDMLVLRRLLNESLEPDMYALASIPVTSNIVAENLLKKINDARSSSKAEVMGFTRNPFRHTAIVPGSSIKGALSTSIIDCLDKVRRTGKQKTLKDADRLDRGINRNCRKNYGDALENMFGDIGEHAMQALKVGDIVIPPDATAIKEAREMGMRPDKQGTPKTPCEALRPSSETGLSLYGHMHLDSKSGQPAITLPTGQSLDLPTLAKLCNDFYGQRFEKEWQKFYQLAHFKAVKEQLEPVRQRIRKLDPAREILLRLGHYSHIECVTVTDNRPQTAKGFGKTRTLADGLLPFGWVIVQFCTEDEYRRGIVAIEQAIDTSLQKRRAAAEIRRNALAQAVEQQRLKAEISRKAREEAEREESRKKREDAEREAVLASLSPEERAIRELSMPGATETQSSALFAMLDSLDQKLLLQAATALQSFWQKIGKWEGKQLSKKQQQKVQKLKSILKE